MYLTKNLLERLILFYVPIFLYHLKIKTDIQIKFLIIFIAQINTFRKRIQLTTIINIYSNLMSITPLHILMSIILTFVSLS